MRFLACVCLLAACGAPAPGEHELLPDGKADGAYPALAPRQLLRAVGETQLRDRRDGSTTTHDFEARYLLTPRAPADTTSAQPLALQLCSVVLGDHAGTGPSNALYAAMPVVTAPIRYFAADDGTVAARTDAPVAIVVGARLDDPLNDPLPTSADDPGVVDLDHDGHPGGSVDAPIGQIYFAARIVVRLDGTVGPDGTLAGDVHLDRADVTVFDDTIPFVDVAGRLAESRMYDETVAERYTFSTTALPAAAGCAEVRAAKP